MSILIRRSILTEIGEDVLALQNSKAMKRAKKKRLLKREIEPIIVVSAAALGVQVVSNNGQVYCKLQQKAPFQAKRYLSGGPFGVFFR